MMPQDGNGTKESFPIMSQREEKKNLNNWMNPFPKKGEESFAPRFFSLKTVAGRQ